LSKLVLILGGARSGKSRLAQEMARRSEGPVLFVATATAGDEDMGRRIAKHRQDRPAGWRTLEATTGIGTQIEQNIGEARTVIIDCITLLIMNIFSRYSDPELEHIDESVLEPQVDAEINTLLHAIHRTPAVFLIVSNEVGLGLVPDNRMGRLYRDLLGRANRGLAQSADEVYFIVSGIPLKIKP
jgi:adenosylcobinamide kinase / adenosylcobinamide-phosphate guanylyltransferase